MISFDEIRKKLEKLKQLPQGKRGFVLVGNTRIGKSTISLMLRNRPLLIKKKHSKMVLEPQLKEDQEFVSSKTTSHTELPNFFTLGEKQQEYLIDMPGTRDIKYLKRILNSIYIRQAIRKMGQVHFCIITELNEKKKSLQDIDELNMFKQIARMFPQSSQYITICVNKYDGISDEQTLKTKLLEFIKKKTGNDKILTNFYTHVLSQNSPLFTIRLPKFEEKDSLLRVDKKLQQYMLKTNFQPVKECVICPANISDEIQDRSFPQSIEHICGMISEKCEQVKDQINELKQKLRLFCKQVMLEVQYNPNKEQFFIECLNIILFIYAQTESLYNEPQFKKEDQKIFAHFLFIDNIQQKVSKAGNERFKNLFPFRNEMYNNMYETYCFMYVLLGNQEAVRVNNRQSFDKIYTQDLITVSDKIKGIYDLTLKNTEKSQNKTNILEEVEKILFFKCHSFLFSEDHSNILGKENSYFQTSLKNIYNLSEIYPFIFNNNKNKEDFEKFENEQIKKKLKKKQDQIKSMRVWVEEIEREESNEKKFKLLKKIEANIPKKAFKKRIKDLLQRIQIQHPKDYAIQFQICEKLEYNVRIYEILKSIKRTQSKELYQLFLYWGDKFAKEKKQEKAQQLYDCAWQCISDFDEEQETQIQERKAKLH